MNHLAILNYMNSPQAIASGGMETEIRRWIDSELIKKCFVSYNDIFVVFLIECRVSGNSHYITFLTKHSHLEQNLPRCKTNMKHLKTSASAGGDFCLSEYPLTHHNQMLRTTKQN